MVLYLTAIGITTPSYKPVRPAGLRNSELSAGFFYPEQRGMKLKPEIINSQESSVLTYKKIKPRKHAKFNTPAKPVDSSKSLFYNLLGSY